MLGVTPLKHIYEIGYAYKPLDHMKITAEPKLAKEETEEMRTEKDGDEMENGKNLKMKHGVSPGTVWHILDCIFNTTPRSLKMKHGELKAKEEMEEIQTEKDQDEMENEKNLKMKHGEMKISKFGLGFELTGFVAFLSWTWMFLYTILGL